MPYERSESLTARPFLRVPLHHKRLRTSPAREPGSLVTCESFDQELRFTTRFTRTAWAACIAGTLNTARVSVVNCNNLLPGTYQNLPQPV